MGFTIETTDMDLGDTSIENIFINDFMPMANGTHVKVYILGYKYAKDRDEGLNITNQLIAKHLEISLEDVLEAWDFWHKLGIIEKIPSNSDDPFDKKYNYGVKFLSLRQLYIKNNLSILKGQSPNVTKDATELDVLEMNKNPEINKLFNAVDFQIRRPSQIGEKRKIIDWINQYNMNTDVIELAFKLAAENESVARSSIFNYVNGTLKNWYDDGLTTMDLVMNHLETRDDRIGIYSNILKSLGQYRLPSQGEKEIMDIWLDEMGFSMEIILEATKRTTTATNPTIGYVDGILKNWNKDGVKTLEDIDNRQANYEKTPKAKQKRAKAKTTGFHNFQGPSQDYSSEQLEDIASRKRREYLEGLKGD